MLPYYMYHVLDFKHQYGNLIGNISLIFNTLNKTHLDIHSIIYQFINIWIHISQIVFYPQNASLLQNAI